MHTMKYIYQAREKGAKVVVIDPLFSQTAAKADLYLRVRSGSDGALALGMARHLVDTGRWTRISSIIFAHGYPEFEQYLRNSITVEWASEICGLAPDVIRQLARNSRRLTLHRLDWLRYAAPRERRCERACD
jgi:anaerobic selenocysteine-containing dehydrogenase